ncbi:hypothetical protein ACJRO7_000562 [Eucalyptus globulus]|uniref:Uncharacterized protein n=1 Tax=Eucalyptus globulus TaxID=34317 RepID=A0ABD3LRM2_EUCGL
MVIVKGQNLKSTIIEGGGFQGKGCCCRQAQSNCEAESCGGCEAEKPKLKPAAKVANTSAKAMPGKRAVKKVSAKGKKKPVKKPKSVKLLVKTSGDGIFYVDLFM